MNGFHRQVLPVYDALQVHQARTIGTDNVFGSRVNMMFQFILPHIDRDSLLFNGKHTAKATALIIMGRLHDFNSFYKIQQILQLIIIRYVQFAGSGYEQLAHSVATIL